MDWSKAKNLLIFLFLVLNIFLATYLFLSFQNDSSSENIANTVQILKSRGYTLNTKIPNISQVYKLIYENGEYDRTFIAEKLLNNAQMDLKKININQKLEDISKTLIFTSKNSFKYSDETPTTNIDISSKGRLEKYAIGFMQELKLPISNPYLDYYKINVDKSITLKFIEKFKGKFIFDNCVEFNISEKGLKTLKCNLVKVKDFDNTKVNIVPAYQILLKNFVEENKSSIERIDLGYEFGIDIGVTGYKTPGWRIILGDGTSSFFDNQGQKK